MSNAMMNKQCGPHQVRPVGRGIAARRIELLGDPTEFMGTNAYVRPATGGDRIAVISDVHGNLQALEAVLEDIAARGISRFWCLGDTAGYGANPVECLRLVREHCELVLAGNHDLAVVGDESLTNFGRHARPGVLHARRELELASDGPMLREWLALRLTEVADARRSIGYDLTYERHLSHHMTDAMRHERIVAAHAAPSPWDSVWDYVGHDVDPAEIRAEMDAVLVLVGHSHQQFACDSHRTHREVDELIQLPSFRSDHPNRRHSNKAVVANPGSVGQPRDGDPRAAWLELDGEHHTLAPHRTAYDVDSAMAAIEKADLPIETARRLATGR